MKSFEPAAQIIEHTLIEYEENPDKFLPNSYSIIEDTINNIPPELDIIDETFKCLIPKYQGVKEFHMLARIGSL